MNKPSDQIQKSGANNNAPSAIKLEMPDLKAGVADITRDVTSKDVTKGPFSQIPAADNEKAPLLAAHGNDDVMSQQQQQAMPTADEIKGKWKQQVGAAKIAWGKLTDDDLLKSEGHEQKLIGLVQERYAITREEANTQVKSFFEKNKS